jgi:hypothetical protein
VTVCFAVDDQQPPDPPQSWPQQGDSGEISFPLFGSLRTDLLDLSSLAGDAGKPPIMRPIELTACDGVVRLIICVLLNKFF